MKMEQHETEEHWPPSHSILDCLPWEDVLFKKVFPNLAVQTLFSLRRVSKQFHECITYYFQTSKCLNLSRIAARCNGVAFQIMTNDNSNLQELNLRNSKDWLTDELLVPVLQRNGRLLLIDISNCTRLTNESIRILALHCPNLCRITLRECIWLSVVAVTNLVLHCRGLTHVDLSGCWNLNDEAVVTMAMCCQQLEFLSIAKIYGVTDHAIANVASYCRRLKHLNMTGCWRVTNESVILLAEYCRDLKALQIRECRDINEQSLCKLREKNVKVDIPKYPYTIVCPLTRSLQRLNVQI
ncbi:F-box/LRR-repeat protein 15-like [Lingula anatina]|uniref:F-box/LRR-repeat protein 15-like n=1 Tax=Lingula anatina TaxID=7574 RepID=A0A1S3HNL7_LINAN|nr:F-box/LRR-repeat protein 15-like [Lingula anatina]|eukprot:XP_013387642.1 F-box/LRR-repeat protein 15-like [Lingula anatina]